MDSYYYFFYLVAQSWTCTISEALPFLELRRES